MSTTDLGEQLSGRGIDTLVLTGIHTSGVVMSTLVEAVDRDYASSFFPTPWPTLAPTSTTSC
jgi:nicotinamidase-related amidase